MNIYYNAVNKSIYIDHADRITTIELPADIDPIEVAYVLQSDTLRAVIENLQPKTKPKGDMTNDKL